MNHFLLKKTPLEGLYLIERSPIKDERGFLERLYCQDTFKTFLNGKCIQQINHTLTRQLGTVRGLHFQQPPDAENKIIMCLKGKVWDVAVDIRRGSPTFLQHYTTILDGDKFESFLIPEGFAHGFQTLTNDCELLYFHTAQYNPQSEGALNALDPLLNIPWPILITELSARDSKHAFINTDYSGIEVI